MNFNIISPKVTYKGIEKIGSPKICLFNVGIFVGFDLEESCNEKYFFEVHEDEIFLGSVLFSTGATKGVLVV